jgi:hypothetical protein
MQSDSGTSGGTGSSGTGGTSGSELGATGSIGALGSEGAGFTTGDDFQAHSAYYQAHHLASPTNTPYVDARSGYALGHVAAANPAYAGRTFEEVEVELEREAGDESRFAAVKGYARHAFEWKTILGALALAGGAWWASRKLAEAASELSEEEERDCRTFYDSHPSRTTVPYDQARTVYVIGYAAARNPDYAGRSYADVEPTLRGGFTGKRAASYDSLRDFTRRGYERGTSRRTS